MMKNMSRKKAELLTNFRNSISELFFEKIQKCNEVYLRVTEGRNFSWLTTSMHTNNFLFMVINLKNFISISEELLKIDFPLSNEGLLILEKLDEDFHEALLNEDIETANI